MKFNPFRPNSIVSPGMFCGRQDEIELIEQSLFQTKHGNPQHFLIEGERGIGKSSLMLYADWLARGTIFRNSSSRFSFLVVSLELKTSSDLLDFIQRMASAIKYEIESKEILRANAKKVWEFLTNWEIMGVKYNKKKSELDPFSAIEELAKVLSDTITVGEGTIDGIFILIDEADKASSETRLGEFVKLLTERLTKIGCEKVCLGLAGLPDILPKLQASHESSLRLFQILSLGVLTQEERKEVVLKGLESVSIKTSREVKIEDDAIGMISTLSEGYPHFIQQFAYESYDVDSDDNIDRNDVITGAFKENGAIQQLGHKYFHKQYFEQISSPDYRKVLHSLAEKLDEWQSRKALLEETKLIPHTLDNALRALRDRGIIISSDEQKGFYRLPNKSFAVWIKAVTKIDSSLNVISKK